MQLQQAEAFANLATATTADRQAVTALSNSNATLTQELRTATATIATLQKLLESCACATTSRIGAKGEQRDKQANNANTIRVATLRHWIQMDIVGRMSITSVRVTMEHRATIPCQDTRVQPPELIRWEEARRRNRSDMQGRTQENWIRIIAIWLTTKDKKSSILI